MATKKLIEVALPLEKINAESAREKSIRHGHPSTLHLWWARRPLASARAVIWSSLVDDPSSHPELFPTEEEQNKERQRLFRILENLVVWENSNNQDVLAAAKAEIMKSTNGNPPALLDPFAGGGAIPLEGQRLGLSSHAHDLNPVAVTINKSMIEIPAIFSGKAPINKGSQQSIPNTWAHANGLAEDVIWYGARLKEKAYLRIGDLYPHIEVKNPKATKENRYNVIAWIWARTVICPNPACGARTPLAHSFILSKKKGNEAYIKPKYNIDAKIFTYEVNRGKFTGKDLGSVTRKGAICCNCGSPIGFDFIREECKRERLGADLMAIVYEDNTKRGYASADPIHINAAKIEKPADYPTGKLAYYPGHLNTNAYGLDSFDKLFTNRQLQMLTSFSELLHELRLEIEKDAIIAGLIDDHIPLYEGGSGARAYSEAISVYLSFVINKLVDRGSSVCSWDSSREGLRNTFGRQAIPMVWDYAEGNPFCNSSGCFDNCLEWVYKCIKEFPATTPGKASQYNAQEDCGLRDILVSTDPPYYDNIGYADLSDYFYIWLRYNLKEVYPSLFSTLLVPKTEELVATPYRFDGSVSRAKDFFEDGMLETCKKLYLYSRDDLPVTIYYAYKQSTVDENNSKSSTGWETMLSAIISAGFAITGTWPMRTEMANRQIASESNALASSIVLVCRKREENAPQITRRNLINILRRELRPALKKLQESNIAPVDLAQSAIGPGMGVFSRYRKVLEADGSAMTVRSALKVINDEIDLYFNEQVGDLDAMSRFCVDLYTQSAFNDIKFGDADILARAKGTSVVALASHDVVYAKAGTVHLIERAELPDKIDNGENCIWMLTQQLTQAIATGGIEACAKAVFMMFGSNAERAKDLAYRLYTIAEQKKWATEAFAYNALVVAWPDIQSRAATMQRDTPEQLDLFSMGLLNT